MDWSKEECVKRGVRIGGGGQDHLGLYSGGEMFYSKGNRNPLENE